MGGKAGNLGNWKETFGSGGKFQSIMPPPLLPHPGHPTMTGTTVVCPFLRVVNQKFSVQAVFVLPSVAMLLGSMVSVAVTAFANAGFFEVAEESWVPSKGAEAVMGAESEPVLDPGKAASPEAKDWL